MKHKRIIRILPVVLILCFFSGCLLEAAPVSASPFGDIMLIIDAGHGGVDCGAVAQDGTVEKDLNLQIAYKVRDLLAVFGVPTRMTRTGDVSIHDDQATTIREKKVSDIRNRMQIIESYDQSIFISIHQNIFSESRYSGTQVFYGAQHPESELLADSIQSAVRNMLQPDNTRQVKKSGSSIYLLYNTTKPAVMVECGFLSNPVETALLKDENYQCQLSFAIFTGILSYLNNTDGNTAEYLNGTGI